MTTEESFHILDLPEELSLSKDVMIAAVKEDPWKADGVETLLVWKKHLLEDMTNKQVLGNRWKLVEQEQRECQEDLGWSRFSKEDSTWFITRFMELGEINQTVWLSH